METRIMEIAERIKGLRELMDIPVEAMAQATGTTVEEYLACENGMNDFSFTFLFKCAEMFGVDMIEILTGDRSSLSIPLYVRAMDFQSSAERVLPITTWRIFFSINWQNRFWLLPLMTKKNSRDRFIFPTMRDKSLIIFFQDN